MVSQLGRYEIIGELGQGAMGIVYKAKDPLIDRTVAIKTISLNLPPEEKEEYEARFYQEARAAGRLSHPNIVTIYDVGKSGDIAYIAMEFLQGRELRDILDEYPLLPIDQVLDIVVQVAQGLAYAHEHGIVHRDVKPANIMIVRDGHAKITDFGIARMASSSIRTQTGMVLGSPKHMSPEQITGKPIDQRTDIFSLGVMLYEMLAGQVPFNGENINTIMYQILNAAPPPLNTLNPAVPDALNLIVAKALAKSPDDRYRNAREFADALRACRNAVPHFDTLGSVIKPQTAPDTTLQDTIPMSVLMEAEKSNPVKAIGLIELAVMTGSPEETGEFAKTLKIARPAMNISSQTTLPIAKPDVLEHPTPVQIPLSGTDATPGKTSNLPLIAILMLVLIGLILALFF